MREVAFLRSRGLATSRISRVGSRDLPNPSNTMMANTMEAKLLSSFTYETQKKESEIASSPHSRHLTHCIVSRIGSLCWTWIEKEMGYNAISISFIKHGGYYLRLVTTSIYLVGHQQLKNSGEQITHLHLEKQTSMGQFASSALNCEVLVMNMLSSSKVLMLNGLSYCEVLTRKAHSSSMTRR